MRILTGAAVAAGIRVCHEGPRDKREAALATMQRSAGAGSRAADEDAVYKMGMGLFRQFPERSHRRGAS